MSDRQHTPNPKRLALLCPAIPLILLLALLSGCAAVPVPTQSHRIGSDDPSGRCAGFLDTLDRRVAEARVIDPGAFRVSGYPYLRVNRFLASFHDAVDDPAAFDAWLDHMQALDQEARKHEIANLPDTASASDTETLFDQVVACGDLLRAADFETAEQRQTLREHVMAPDEYILPRRILGIYPITRLFIAMGVSRWHARMHETFSNDAPPQRHSIRYLPAAHDGLHSGTEAIVADAERDALGIPRYSEDQLDILFRRHAPIWEVHTQSDYDRIGMPHWRTENAIAIDTRRPEAYTLLSHTRFQGQVLTQLNYIIWYPARPKVNALDIYGGHLDGLNYRVTLDRNGQPLLYDSVHNCGCYYAAYPTPHLTARERIDYGEPPLILKAPRETHEAQLMTVAMESRTHFVMHFYPSVAGDAGGAETAQYSLAPYERLRSLADKRGGHRSMFDPDSLAPDSKRLERWLFWPTGVLSPGAMRQWGRHAVAFVGKRHFDDPFFMDLMFE
jgi:hypothetical protein